MVESPGSASSSYAAVNKSCRGCSGFWAAALELVVIETFGVGKYERFSSWDVTPVTDTVPKTMH